MILVTASLRTAPAHFVRDLLLLEFSEQFTQTPENVSWTVLRGLFFTLPAALLCPRGAHSKPFHGSHERADAEVHQSC